MESGIISNEEFEKQKEIIEGFEYDHKKVEEDNKKTEEIHDEESKKSDKILVYLILGIILLFVIFFGYRILTREQPETLDELHLFNLKGKLKPEQGYLYNGVHSFVKFDNLWYLQLKSPLGSRLYDMALRYGPRDIEDIRINGILDTELFNNATDYFVTFNPEGNDFSHVALAVGDFNTHMTTVFFKTPIAACDRNETFDCSFIPTITCDNTDKVVIYIKEAGETNVYYDGNCIVVEGSGFDLVKGVDRVLLNLYDIMEQ